MSPILSEDKKVFSVDPTAREMLLKGLDEIGLTEQSIDLVARFEEQDQARRPWVYLSKRLAAQHTLAGQRRDSILVQPQLFQYFCIVGAGLRQIPMQWRLVVAKLDG